MSMGEPRAVEAQQFVLRDAHGVVRARLGVGPGGDVVFSLHDPEGRSRAGLMVHADGASRMDLINEQGEAEASLSVTATGPALALFAGSAARLVAMITHEGPAIALLDESSRRRLTITRNDAGTSVAFTDADGTPRGGMHMPDGGPVWIAGTQAQENGGTE